MNKAVIEAFVFGRAHVMNLKFIMKYPDGDKRLLRHLTEAGLYKRIIEKAAARYSFAPSLIAAVGSRESGWGILLEPPGPAGTGDFSPRKFPAAHRLGPLPPDGLGFGRGLMQIDYDFHEFARSGNWMDPEENISYGVNLLSRFRNIIEKRIRLQDRDLFRATVASYNAGPGRIIKAIRESWNVDCYTSGKNYSMDVFARAAFFRERGWD